MKNHRRTPTEAVIEYALAVEAVRVQTRIMGANRCTEMSAAEFSLDGMGAPPVESCMSQHWSLVTTREGSETPALAFDEMCEPCKVRLQAFNDRREAKRRLGAAKRSVEAIGKRENQNHISS